MDAWQARTRPAGRGPEQQRLARMRHFQDEMMGYGQHPGHPPQTLGYALNDSPAGQLAWIVEKFKEWTDPSAELPEDAVDRDHLLTNVGIYWFTATAGSSADLYHENAHDPGAWAPKARGTVPTGVAASLTQDEFLVGDVRAFFRRLRAA